MLKGQLNTDQRCLNTTPPQGDTSPCLGSVKITQDLKRRKLLQKEHPLFYAHFSPRHRILGQWQSRHGMAVHGFDIHYILRQRMRGMYLGPTACPRIQQ